MRILGRFIGETDRVQQGPGPLPPFGAAATPHPETEGDVVDRVHVREEAVVPIDGLASRLAVLQRRPKPRRRDQEPSGAAYGSYVNGDASGTGGHRA
jgi:hypothetical protein